MTKPRARDLALDLRKRNRSQSDHYKEGLRVGNVKWEAVRIYLILENCGRVSGDSIYCLSPHRTIL